MEGRREKFELWVSQMDKQLDYFVNSFDDSMKEKLDFSLESFDVLETWLLKSFASYQDFSDPKVANFVDYLARYIGETICRNINAKWDISLSDPNDELYGMPIIVEASENEFIACPHALPTAIINRKTGHFLMTLLAMLIHEWGEKTT